MWKAAGQSRWLSSLGAGDGAGILIRLEGDGLLMRLHGLIGGRRNCRADLRQKGSAATPGVSRNAHGGEKAGQAQDKDRLLKAALFSTRAHMEFHLHLHKCLARRRAGFSSFRRWLY